MCADITAEWYEPVGGMMRALLIDGGQSGCRAAVIEHGRTVATTTLDGLPRQGRDYAALRRLLAACSEASVGAAGDARGGGAGAARDGAARGGGAGAARV